MEHRIVFDPELDIDPAAFAAAWNSTPECAAVARAQVQGAATKSFDPWVNDLFVIVTSVGLGVAGNAFYDLIKNTLIKQPGNAPAAPQLYERITYVDIPQSDGTSMTLVQIERFQ